MKIHFHGSHKPQAQDALAALKKAYKDHTPEEADAIVVVGGDGMMLHSLHAYIGLKKPFYGLNAGTLGFLLNEFRPDDLPARIKAAKSIAIHPLSMKATGNDGKVHEALAFNEVSLIRETHITARLKITINGTERLSELVCDGVMVSTPMGSTAYNSSAGGTILPLDANLLAMTPMSPFRPRRWHGALLHNDSKVVFDVLHSIERPVSATADSTEIRDIAKVEISQDKKIAGTLLFDPGNHLAERIFKEQFSF